MGGQKYVMLGIFKALDGKVTLTHFKSDVGMGEPAAPFEPALAKPLTYDPNTIEAVIVEPPVIIEPMIAGGWSQASIEGSVAEVTAAVEGFALEVGAALVC